MRALFDHGEYNTVFHPKKMDEGVGLYTFGLWQVQCSAWSPAIVKECWDQLRKYVASGEAGYGVRCLLADRGRTIELYCHSAILRYMYLLLHLVSCGQVEGCNVLWLDCNGHVRVEM